MTTLHLEDASVGTDLGTYLARARTLDPDGAVRLQAFGTTLAVYVAVLEGHGLLGAGTVLGLRVVGLAEPAQVDAAVPLAAVADRLARPGVGDTLAVPPNRVSPGWAAIAPPRGGWEPVGSIDAESLRVAARHGIEEIATGSPADTGGHAVRALRERVWSRETATVPPVPAGAAFAAYTLGFLTEDVRVFAHGRWTRLTTGVGHVLLR